MIEFTMTWWQLLLLGIGTHIVTYLAGVVVGKQSMFTMLMSKQQMPMGMPQMPQMPNSAMRQ